MSGRAAAGRAHPALVLAASDLALLAAFALPAVARRVRANRWVVPGDGSILLLPDLSFASLDRPTTLAALGYDGWRPGVAVRTAVVLALHTLLAVQVARRAAPGRAVADVRLAVLAASPLLGGLAGLTLVVPSALRFDTTVEDREVVREVALGSFLDGATWGLAAGITAALALTVVRRVTAAAAPAAGPGAEVDEEADRREAQRAVRGAVAAGLAAAGIALALVVVLGGRAFAGGPGPYGTGEARRLLGYVHWALEPTGLSGYQPVDYVPVFVLPLYLLAVLMLGAVAGAVMARRSLPLRVAAAWWAVTVALLAYAASGAVLRTVAVLQRDPDGPGGSWSRLAVATVNDVVTALPALAAYTALLGWVPAAAAAAAVGRALRREEAAVGPTAGEGG